MKPEAKFVLSSLVTVCGISSRFSHVTSVPTGTVNTSGVKVKFSITTWEATGLAAGDDASCLLLPDAIDAAVASLPARPLAARKTAPTAIVIAPPATTRRVTGCRSRRRCLPSGSFGLGGRDIAHAPLSFASHRSRAATWLPGPNTPDLAPWIASREELPGER